MESVGSGRTDTRSCSSPAARRGLAMSPLGAALLALAALAGPVLLLSVMSPEFPIDDAYIHFQYARNFAETGRMEFNLGEFRGLGTTSLLWVLLLAGGVKLGVSPENGALLLGVLAALCCAFCVRELVLPAFRRLRPEHAESLALGVAVLVALSGNLIWFSLSGMETSVFLSLCLLALVAYQRGCYSLLGASIGLAALCRPEGLALIPALLAVEIVRVRSGGRALWGRWALAAVLVAVPVILWLVWLHSQTGTWLPTSFSGKRICQLAAIDRFIEKMPWLGLYVGSAQALFVFTWLAYILMYVFGVASVPGPTLSYSGEVGASVSAQLSWTGMAIAVLVMVPLVVLGIRELVRFCRAADLRDPCELGVLATWIWVMLHNAAYMVMLPTLGTTTRYEAINHVLIWWVVALGLCAVRSRRVLYVPAVLVLTVLVGSNLAYWRGVYEANLAHMRQVRIAAARYLATELPPTARVAAFDIGALRYFGERTIVDLGGLTDTDFTTYQAQGRVDQYLKDRRVDYIALPEKHSTDREALFDFAQYLGITQSPMFDLELLASFETDRDLWKRGFDATANYQPAVRVRKVHWRDSRWTAQPGDGHIPGEG